jgi:molybdate transport system permease protein
MPLKNRLVVVLALPLLALLSLPLVGLLGRSSVSEVWQALGSAAVQQALGLSILTSTITLVLCVVLGTPLAIWLSQGQHPWATLIVDLPTVLPPAVAGLALLSLFGRTGWIGSHGLLLAFTTTAVVIAQLFVAAPLYVRATVVALNAIDDDIGHAATIDGADVWQMWRYITIPLAWPGIQAGIALALARALGEFGATALFAGSLPGRTRTLALAIYVAAETDPAAAIAMSVVLLFTAMALLFLMKNKNDVVQ